MGAVAMAAFPSEDVKKAGGGIAGHIFGGLIERFADWFQDETRPQNAKNHHLRELLVISIRNVLDGVAKEKPGGTQGGERLTHYRSHIHARLDDVIAESRFIEIREASIPQFFKSRLDDFAEVTMLTPNIWKSFLEPDYEALIGNVKDYKLNNDQLAALNAASDALHKKLPRHLVDAYRQALEHHPEVYVALQTAILQEIWNGVSRVEGKLDSAVQSIQSQIRAQTKALTEAHPQVMQSYVHEFAATAGGFRVVLDEMVVLARATHANVAELLRRDNERSANNGSASAAPLTPAEIKEKTRPYLGWLIQRTKIIELRGIKHGDAPVIQLELKDAYVPLQAKRLHAAERSPATGIVRRDLRLVWNVGEVAKVEPDVPMEKVLGEGNRLAITGGAGCGKTTVLRYIAWRLSTALQDEKALSEAARLGLAENVRLPVPILVSCASFARYLRDLPGHAPGNLESFLSHDLEHNEATFELSPDFFKQLLKEGRDVILLLDGLDEVADTHERERMRDWIAKFSADRKALRVMVSCRTVAYRNDAALANFREIAVQPLDMEKHIAPMVRQAYACINVDQREVRIAQLLRGIEQLEQNRRASPGYDGKPLVDSPLMVRLMLIVQMNNRELPDERAELFDKAVDALFQVEYGVDVENKKEIAKNWERFRDMAQHLAFHLHQQGKDQGREIEEPELKNILRKEADFKPHVDDFLRLVRLRGGVVEERGGKFLFMHHAFQEFLVARYLREVMYGDKGRQGVLDHLGQWLQDPWWREPILLMTGYRASASPNEARKLIGALATAGASPNAQFSAAELAGTSAMEWHDSGVEIRTLCAQRIVALLGNAEALQNSNPVIRARVGDVLAHLGDPRFDSNCFYLPANDPMFGFVEIPEDKRFKIGTRKADAARVAKVIGSDVELADEINDSLTPTPTFYLARYPVTVAQFRAFVVADKVKIDDESALRDPDSRPVRYVSWREALQYCEWLHRQFTVATALKNSGITKQINTGWRITLPSELEWEKAARGASSTIFPWGDDADSNRANYDDTLIGDTSAMGCFAANALGLYDMVGNVWEWTRNRYENYPYDAKDGRVTLASNDLRRALRGGRWDWDLGFARCAPRLRFGPTNLNLGFGFRTVLRSPLF